MMTTLPVKTDVVIVGAGPTGLMAALLLARSGVQVRILDKTLQQAHESRAFGVQAKSMELLLNLGLAEAFLNRGLMATGVQIFVNGKQRAEINFDDIGRNDTPYSFLLMVPQREIEALLVAELHTWNVVVEHTMEVIDFQQTAEGVSVQAKNSLGECVAINADYLIGADGAHSLVRNKLAIPFVGAPYPQGFLLADCKMDWSLDYDHMKLFLQGRNLAFYLPLRGQDVARLIVMKPDDHQPTAAAGAEPATLTEVQRAMDAATGLAIKLHDPLWISGYRVHHRGATTYREGRVFIAGDAAHIHSPAGGQGMNTGLQDVANLVWKLVLTLKSHPAASLLDTYHAERWPVGQKVLRRTDKMFAGMSSQNPWTAWLRCHLVPLFAKIAARSVKLRARLFNFISQLGIRYHDNFFLSNDVSSPLRRHDLAAGCRAPNGMIARNLDVFSLITGYAFHVLALSKQSLTQEEIGRIAEALKTLPTSIGLPLKTHFITRSLLGRDPRIICAESNQVFTMYQLTRQHPQAIFLIRPDGYIAYRSDEMSIAGIQQFIQTRF